MYDFFYGFYKKRLGSNLFYRDNSTFVSPQPPVLEVLEDNSGDPLLDNNDNNLLDNG